MRFEAPSFSATEEDELEEENVPLSFNSTSTTCTSHPFVTSHQSSLTHPLSKNPHLPSLFLSSNPNHVPYQKIQAMKSAFHAKKSKHSSTSTSSTFSVSTPTPLVPPKFTYKSNLYSSSYSKPTHPSFLRPKPVTTSHSTGTSKTSSLTTTHASVSKPTSFVSSSPSSLSLVTKDKSKGLSKHQTSDSESEFIDTMSFSSSPSSKKMETKSPNKSQFTSLKEKGWTLNQDTVESFKNPMNETMDFEEEEEEEEEEEDDDEKEEKEEMNMDTFSSGNHRYQEESESVQDLTLTLSDIETESILSSELEESYDEEDIEEEKDDSEDLDDMDDEEEDEEDEDDEEEEDDDEDFDMSDTEKIKEKKTREKIKCVKLSENDKKNLEGSFTIPSSLLMSLPILSNSLLTSPLFQQHRQQQQPLQRFKDPALFKFRSFRAFFTPQNTLVTWCHRTIHIHTFALPSSTWSYSPFPLLEKLATSIQPNLTWDSEHHVPRLPSFSFPFAFHDYLDVIPSNHKDHRLYQLLSILFDPLLPDPEKDTSLRWVSLKSRLLRWLESHLQPTVQAYARHFLSQQRYVLAIFLHLCVQSFEEAKAIAVARKCTFVLSLLCPLPPSSPSSSSSSFTSSSTFPTMEPPSLPFKDDVLTVKDKLDFTELLMFSSMDPNQFHSSSHSTWLQPMPFCLVFLILSWAFPKLDLKQLMQCSSNVSGHVSQSSFSGVTFPCPLNQEIQSLLAYFVSLPSLTPSFPFSASSSSSLSTKEAPLTFSNTSHTLFLNLCHLQQLNSSSSSSMTFAPMDVLTFFMLLTIAPPQFRWKNHWLVQYAHQFEVSGYWWWSSFLGVFLSHPTLQQRWLNHVLSHHVNPSVHLHKEHETWLHSHFHFPSSTSSTPSSSTYSSYLAPWKAWKTCTQFLWSGRVLPLRSMQPSSSLLSSHEDLPPFTSPAITSFYLFQTAYQCCLLAGPDYYSQALNLLCPYLPILIQEHRFQLLHDLLSLLPSSSWMGLMEWIFKYVQLRLSSSTSSMTEAWTELLEALTYWESLHLQEVHEAHWQCLRLIQDQCEHELQLPVPSPLQRAFHDYQCAFESVFKS